MAQKRPKSAKKHALIVLNELKKPANVLPSNYTLDYFVLFKAGFDAVAV